MASAFFGRKRNEFDVVLSAADFIPVAVSLCETALTHPLYDFFCSSSRLSGGLL